MTPGIVGLNYYVTSDRYLDERRQLYPPESHGGNGRIWYADVEAARVGRVGIRGHAAVLEEVWRRYGVPVAITEAHLGCTREEQMRWLGDAWEGAQEARRRGVDVRAVTAWALLGSWDWDSLVTRTRGHYEPGAFDVRGRTPRPTALATMVRALADGRTFIHPVMSRRGLVAAIDRRDRSCIATRAEGGAGVDPRRGRHVRPCRRASVREPAHSVRRPVAARPRRDRSDHGPAGCPNHRPWAIINAAGYVRVDDAEADRSRMPARERRRGRDSRGGVAKGRDSGC